MDPKAGTIGGICTKCMLVAGMASEPESLNRTKDAGKSGRSEDRKRRLKAPSSEELESEFPNLEVLEVAGMGGMGVVYKVRQKDLNRVVALKILPCEFGSDPAFTARFSQEAKTLAMLNHRNVVHLYEAGQTEKYCYFLMEYVDGELFPYLKGFKQRAESPNTIEYKIGEIFGEIKNKIQSGYSLRDALEKVDELQFRSQEAKHELSHLYEVKIKNMGNAGRARLQP